MKDHISNKTKSIQQQFKKYFDFDIQSILKALSGDAGEIKKLGEQGRKGRIVQEVAPIISQAASDAMKGTAAFNKTLAEVAAEGARSGISIDRSVMKATLANTKYRNDRSQLAKEFVTARDAEKFRHESTMEYLTIKGEIDKHISVIDTQAKIRGELNKGEVKQLAASEAQEIELTKHLLTYGEESQVHLLNQKDYTLPEAKKKGLIQGFLRLFGG